MKVEHVDDLALLSSQFDSIGLSDLFDEYLGDHGNWEGLSGGKLVCGWLLYILSEADHRLSHVQDWASQRIQTLSALLDAPTCQELDFSDDRLGRLLDRYGDDNKWHDFEQALGKSFLEVYLLPEAEKEGGTELQVIRSDSFNAPKFGLGDELFKFGHTKHRRSDQVQCKVMTAALDPHAIPLAVEIVGGNGPDYAHYLPVIERVREMLTDGGNLYVGDSHMSSSGNRHAIHQAGDYYLSPLNAKQCSRELLNSYLDRLPVSVDQLPGIDPLKIDTPQRARYHELEHEMDVDDKQWKERRILCYSLAYATKQLKSFNNRLDEVEEKIKTLVINKSGRRNPKTLVDLHGRIATLLKKYKAEGCFTITTSQVVDNYTIHKSRDRPTRTGQQVTLHLNIKRNEEVIAAQRMRKGWQIYATNAPVERISAADLICHYRNQYRIEHLFDYAINRDTGLLPLYLKKERRIKGLIRLLMVAMRFSCILQVKARKKLKEQQAQLAGIYPGNKGRKTPDPTTPMLLRAMRGISLVFHTLNGVTSASLTELSSLQTRILELTGSDNVYQRLLQVLNSTFHLRET